MRPKVLVVPVLAGALVLSAVAPAGAADTSEHSRQRQLNPVETAADDAIAFIVGEQRDDGGFGEGEVGFAGFETPDAVLAIAEAAQTDDSWSAAEARDAVVAIESPTGNTPLDYLDGYAEGVNAGQAAKLILLVTAPLGLDADDFDPSGDSPTPVDLAALVVDGLRPDGSYGLFGETLVAVQALALLGEPVPDSTLAFVRAAQQADGGWNFSGDPTLDDIDADTTGNALAALVAAGVRPTAPVVLRGLRYLARIQAPSGAWPSEFDPGNPNSTALGVLGATAAGWAPDRCFRDTLVPARAGGRYGAPLRWLRSQQAADGHVASPVDEFGVNTFATSQSVQAWLGRWLPVERAGEQCERSLRRFVRSLDRDLVFDFDGAARRRLVGDLVRGDVTRPGAVARLMPRYPLQAVYGYVLTYLGRPPAENDLALAGELARPEVSHTDVKAMIIGSEEYFEGHGGNVSGFVRAVFRDVIGRAGTPRERATLRAAVQLGIPRVELVRVLFGTSEGRRFTVRQLYDDLAVDPYPGLLGRAPTLDERRRGVARLGGGDGEERIVFGLAASWEYFVRSLQP